MNGWVAKVDPDLLGRFARVYIGRELPGGDMEIIVSANATSCEVRREGANTASLEGGWLNLPMGAVEALAEAVKPGPDRGEVAQLKDALRLERERVGMILRAFVDRPR